MSRPLPDEQALRAFRAAHPAWSVRRVDYGDGYTGQRGGPPSLFGATLPDLAGKISAFETANRRCVFCGAAGPLTEHAAPAVSVVSVASVIPASALAGLRALPGDLVCADAGACLARGRRQPGAR